MTVFLRQSTASQEVLLGPFVDSTDGNTAETGLTIANTDIKLHKTGATTLASKNSGGATHISDGEYYAVLDATDTDTVGPMVVRVKVAGALAVRLFCVVLEEAMFDWLFGTAVPLSPTTAGRTLDVSAGGEAGIDWANVGSPTTSLNLSGTTVKTATDVETDTQDIQARLPAALGANGNIKADVRDYNGTAGTFASGRPEVNTTHAAGTAWGSGAITAASIAADAITAAKIADGAIDAATFAASALDGVWSVSARTLTAGTNIQLPSNGLANVTAWTVAITGNITGNLSGSVGSVTGNVGGNVVGSVASVVGAVGSVTGLTASNLDATVSSRLASAGYTAPPTAAQNATAVLTTQMTESYATDGAAPTLTQAVMLTQQVLTESSVNSTTMTVKKVDGSTTAATLTLNDATAPTSVTRAS